MKYYEKQEDRHGYNTYRLVKWEVNEDWMNILIEMKSNGRVKIHSILEYYVESNFNNVVPPFNQTVTQAI